MKRYKKALAIISLTLLSIATTLNSAIAVPSSFTFTGSGYGHGVGLSQIGAKGQALEGKSASAILTYYFPGASITPVIDAAPIRVNTAHQITSATFSIVNQSPSTPAGINLTNLGDDNAPTTLINNPIKFTLNGKLITAVSKSRVLGTSSLWSMTLSSPTSYLVQNVSGKTIKLKYGSIQLKPVPVTGKGSLIEISDTMQLHDEYLYGISEVPSMWPAAALQAQAITARTYAMSRLGIMRPDCDCNVYATKYDQVYGGYAKELEPKYGALWRAAVDATKVDDQSGYAITFNDLPINVYFFSSSGGQTQRSIDVWGTDIPYLVSVPDPWSLDKKLNPSYAKWVRVIPQDVMASAFKLPDVASYEINSRTKTGSVLKITATSSSGVKKTLSVGAFKIAVKLPSSWFN
jgi:SpoIID/LytB domain protein